MVATQGLVFFKGSVLRLSDKYKAMDAAGRHQLMKQVTANNPTLAKKLLLLLLHARSGSVKFVTSLCMVLV